MDGRFARTGLDTRAERLREWVDVYCLPESGLDRNISGKQMHDRYDSPLKCAARFGRPRGPGVSFVVGVSLC